MNDFSPFKKKIVINNWTKAYRLEQMEKGRGSTLLQRTHSMKCEQAILLSEGKLWQVKIADCKLQMSKEIKQ